ncbi:DUF6518 family protein [Frigoribacterium sp. 2-23]|uniref:DUF6518 family protein n=1 Tax=Frigoribacterium sp. 2-23 TaxID=3415006 RepID=UPI003C6F0B9B
MIAIETEAPPRPLRSIWSAADVAPDERALGRDRLASVRRGRSSRSPRPARRGPARIALGVAVVLLAAFVVGGLTSIGQQHLPDALGSLANSAAPWALVAVALTAALRPRWWLGALVALASLVLMNVGYGVVSTAGGFFYDGGLTSIWSILALVVGPVLGVAAVWLRSRAAIRTALATAAIATVPIGEGLHGLLRVADTTNPVYWAVEVAVGVGFVVVMGFRLRGAPSAIALAASLAGVGATLYVLAIGMI